MSLLSNISSIGISVVQLRAIRDTYKLLPLKESADLNYLCKFILKTGSNITNRALGLIGRVPDCQLGVFQFKSGRARQKMKRY